MFEQGLVEEVRGLLDRWKELGHTAAQAVGYREVIDHLAGTLSFEEMREKVRVRTRRFARHQETWFRGMLECLIVDLEESFEADEVAQRLIEMKK